MTPIQPLLDTPTGRLAELVHLVSGSSLSEAVTAVSSTNLHTADGDDPLWVVASALVEVRTRQRSNDHSTETRSTDRAAMENVYQLRIPA